MDHEYLEKRISKRYPPSVYVNIYDASTKQFFGLMADLSKTGFKLTTRQALEVEQPYHLALRNPFESATAPLCAFLVKSKWIRTREDGVFESGFEFIDLEKTSEELIVLLNENFEAFANQSVEK